MQIKYKLFSILLLLPITVNAQQIALSPSATNNDEKLACSSFLYPCNPNLENIAPYLGLDPDFLTMIPLYNQDLKLLQRKQMIFEDLAKSGKSFYMPIFEISGNINGQTSSLVNQHNSASNSANAELDLASYFNPWLTGYIALIYNTQAMPGVFLGINQLSLDRAFFTLGDLSKSPFYITAGKRYLPFGQYNSYTVPGPLTRAIGKTDDPALLLGYQHTGKDGLYASIYTFRSSNNSLNSNVPKAEYGGAVGGEWTSNKKFSANIGIDFIHNILDAQGFQMLGSVPLKINAMPGIDLHATVTMKPITLLAEYTSALNRFNALTLPFNNGGAKPGAWDVEAGYNFKLWERVSSFALSYQRTSEAAALGLPWQRESATVNYSILTDLIFSVEYQYNINYAQSPSICGQSICNAEQGKYSNVLLGKLAFYF